MGEEGEGQNWRGGLLWVREKNSAEIGKLFRVRVFTFKYAFGPYYIHSNAMWPWVSFS